MKPLDCHPEHAFFGRREPAQSLPKGIWARRATSPVLCDTIIARLARFLINPHSLPIRLP